MRRTSEQLIQELSKMVDVHFAHAVVECYVEMQQRFLAGDWQPAELDGGRFCEAVSRCLFQMDTGKIDHRQLPGDIRRHLLNKSIPHKLGSKDRYHLAKVIEVVYGFRSDRGAVHISTEYTANYMDSMLVLHASKWIFAEFLRLVWNRDQKVVAETIAQIVQLEHSVIHELDGKPLILARDISATDEVLLLLYHAANNRLSRVELREQAAGQSSQNVNVAVSRLIKNKEIRPVAEDEVALTPNGQKRILEQVLPKYTPQK
ncbi:hypothetical protein ACX27_03630 [Nostoc piscinale CENA21]|uniref:Uncharacterized protein n=1 Tax=Nostoc piscinale CENA21 TaxID=224013 RepID=A0A0M4SZZ0_9NOSO|nr:hypothetical protein [Nostoc piscinale]ALF52145.1 hypothetical protein ACX27_03630 [Nostoc piscinale CENA21]